MPSPLTPREKDVGDLLVQGFNVPTVARKLGIRPTTVKKHTMAVYAKLGITHKHHWARRIALVLMWKENHAEVDTLKNWIGWLLDVCTATSDPNHHPRSTAPV